jgi:hypothetical protein
MKNSPGKHDGQLHSAWTWTDAASTGLQHAATLATPDASHFAIAKVHAALSKPCIACTEAAAGSTYSARTYLLSQEQTSYPGWESWYRSMLSCGLACLQVDSGGSACFVCPLQLLRSSASEYWSHTDLQSVWHSNNVHLYMYCLCPMYMTIEV